MHDGVKNVCVYGNGSSEYGVMFIGEAPGKNEDLHNRPFIGAAGDLLNSALAIGSIEREQVYVTNIVKCRPPNNRKPTHEEVGICASAYLLDEYIEVDPKFVMLMGNTALHALTIREGGISKNRGRILFPDHIFNVMTDRDGATHVPEVWATYHPAAALRSIAVKEIFERDIFNFCHRIRVGYS